MKYDETCGKCKRSDESWIIRDSPCYYCRNNPVDNRKSMFVPVKEEKENGIYNR